jgi:hypothetical protein
MALIPIYCPNESCKHLGFVSVEKIVACAHVLVLWAAKSARAAASHGR